MKEKDFCKFEVQVGIKSYGPAAYRNCDCHMNKIYNQRPGRKHRAHVILSRSHVWILCSILEEAIRIGLLIADISRGLAMCDCNDLKRDVRDLASQLKSPYMHHQL